MIKLKSSISWFIVLVPFNGPHLKAHKGCLKHSPLCLRAERLKHSYRHSHIIIYMPPSVSMRSKIRILKVQIERALGP